MQDRVPLYPGRVTLTPVAGQANTYDMARADQPSQEGTPLNKGSLLKDSTAALFGLGTDAVPDDALALIGKYNQYWWRRRTKSKQPVLTQFTVQTGSSTSGNADGVKKCYVSRVLYEQAVTESVPYSDNIDVDSAGAISLRDPQTIDISYNTYSDATALRGKYYKNSEGNIFHVPSSATPYQHSSGNYYYTYLNVLDKITVVDAYTDWSYVSSSDRNAYPDSGSADGWEYQYLGIPFDNAIMATIKIAVGTYTGLGVYGADNPNSLTFDFEPKFVFVYSLDTLQYYVKYHGTSYFNEYLLWGAGLTLGEAVYSSGYSYKMNFTQDGKTLTWYASDASSSKTASPDYQLNIANKNYGYIAIG